MGALVYPGLCLNLTDYGVIEELRAAYEVLKTRATGKGMPMNSSPKNGVLLLRRLDCAVIEMLHQLRRQAGLDSYDTVFGVFDEGDVVIRGRASKKRRISSWRSETWM